MNSLHGFNGMELRLLKSKETEAKGKCPLVSEQFFQTFRCESSKKAILQL